MSEMLGRGGTAATPQPGQQPGQQSGQLTLDQVSQQVGSGDPASFGQAADQVAQAASLLGQVSDDFTRQSKALETDWTGESASAYSQLASEMGAQIDALQQFCAIQDLLNQGGDALTQAQARVRDLEMQRQQQPDTDPSVFDQQAAQVMSTLESDYQNVGGQLSDGGELQSADVNPSSAGGTPTLASAMQPGAAGDAGNQTAFSSESDSSLQAGGGAAASSGLFGADGVLGSQARLSGSDTSTGSGSLGAQSADQAGSDWAPSSSGAVPGVLGRSSSASDSAGGNSGSGLDQQAPLDSGEDAGSGDETALDTDFAEAGDSTSGQDLPAAFLPGTGAAGTGTGTAGSRQATGMAGQMDGPATGNSTLLASGQVPGAASPVDGHPAATPGSPGSPGARPVNTSAAPVPPAVDVPAPHSGISMPKHDGIPAAATGGLPPAVTPATGVRTVASVTPPSHAMHPLPAGSDGGTPPPATASAAADAGQRPVVRASASTPGVEQPAMAPMAAGPGGAGGTLAGGAPMAPGMGGAPGMPAGDIGHRAVRGAGPSGAWDAENALPALGRQPGDEEPAVREGGRRE